MLRAQEETQGLQVQQVLRVKKEPQVHLDHRGLQDLQVPKVHKGVKEK